ncbi:hypothetical protein MNB_SUP05-SYMBIONT-5-361 [hydrothermal vent metagenome]|uniref:Uncharacterized protein n=1 Tax=hydrothermal vent metagenome TaxID=652676 RepID=A0A1W1E5H2_9ZZZZ
MAFGRVRDRFSLRKNPYPKRACTPLLGRSRCVQMAYKKPASVNNPLKPHQIQSVKLCTPTLGVHNNRTIQLMHYHMPTEKNLDLKKIMQKKQSNKQSNILLTIIFIPVLMMSVPTKVVFASNFNANELQALKKVEQYIRSTAPLIEKAKGMQIVDSRYKFGYDALRQDLAEVSNSIQRFINQNKRSQAPRVIKALIKEY